MPLPRRVVLALVLVALPALAGCNVRNWYNQEGIVSVELATVGPADSVLDELSRVQVAIFGLSLRQAAPDGGVTATPKVYSFGNDPLLVDLVEKGKAGERVPLAKFKTNIRATAEVIIRMQVIEAIDAAGNPMQVCRPQDVVTKWPCFYVPEGNAYEYSDKPFAPPRGGEVVVGFPIEVAYEQRGSASQYFLYADPSLIELENRR